MASRSRQGAGVTAIFELRRYRLHPGTFDVLHDVFTRELVAPQEALGMAVIGPYRDRDAPDDFVWFRRFESLAARAPALEAFYGGPDWGAHKDVANATMIAFDDVRLLRLISGAIPSDAALRVITAPHGTGAAPPPDAGAVFVTHPGPNHFPRLPVREDEAVTVLVSRAETTTVPPPPDASVAHLDPAPANA